VSPTLSQPAADTALPRSWKAIAWIPSPEPALPNDWKKTFDLAGASLVKTTSWFSSSLGYNSHHVATTIVAAMT
jgi:hypothetical protein